MQLHEYVSRAQDTESIIPAVKADPYIVQNLLSIMISAGNMLDMVKKNAFYRDYKDGVETIRRPYDGKKWKDLAQQLGNAAMALHMNSDVSDFDSEPLDVNTRVFHSIVGIATESTELLEALQASLVNGRPFDEINLQEELGDLAWYQAIMVNELQADWEKVMETNITKLEARNKGKQFNAQATVERDVAAERALLTQGDARARAEEGYPFAGSDY